MLTLGIAILGISTLAALCAITFQPDMENKIDSYTTKYEDKAVFPAVVTGIIFLTIFGTNSMPVVPTFGMPLLFAASITWCWYIVYHYICLHKGLKLEKEGLQDDSSS